MWKLLIQFGVGFSIALSGALLPGPLLAFVSMKTLDSGAKTGTLAALGHILVELGILFLAALGLNTLLKSELFSTTIGSVGGILLLGLGFLILSKSRNPPKSSDEIAGKDHNPIVGGILFSTILNPSVALWWMTVGLATLIGAMNTAGLAGAIFWVAGHFSADLGWYSTISYSVHKGKEIIGSGFYKGLLIVSGLTLLIFGIYFSIDYIPKLIAL